MQELFERMPGSFIDLKDIPRTASLPPQNLEFSARNGQVPLSSNKQKPCASGVYPEFFAPGTRLKVAESFWTSTALHRYSMDVRMHEGLFDLPLQSSMLEAFSSQRLG